MTFKTIVKIGFVIWLLPFILAPRLALGGGFNAGTISVLLAVFFGFLFIPSLLKSRKFIYFLLVLLTIVGYAVVVALVYQNDYSHYIKLSISTIVSVMFGYISFGLLQKYVYGNSEEDIITFLLKAICYIIFFNSCIVLLESVNPPFRFWLESYLHNDPNGNISYMTHPFRVRGLAATGGASLSVVNALIIRIISLLSKKGAFKLPLLFMTIIAASNIFIGRTGLILALIFMIVHIASSIKYTRIGMQQFKTLAFYALLVFVGISYASTLEYSEEGVSWAFEWLEGLISNKSIETDSTDDLQGMLYLPSNILHLIFGIGFYEGTNQFYPRTDSGYLKTILSIGIAMGLVLYAALMHLMYQLGKWSQSLKFVLWFAIPFFLLIEIKEPFLYQNYFSRILFLFFGGYLFFSFKATNEKCVD
jgi:hypothetical protein